MPKFLVKYSRAGFRKMIMIIDAHIKCSVRFLLTRWRPFPHHRPPATLPTASQGAPCHASMPLHSPCHAPSLYVVPQLIVSTPSTIYCAPCHVPSSSHPMAFRQCLSCPVHTDTIVCVGARARVLVRQWRVVDKPEEARDPARFGITGCVYQRERANKHACARRRDGLHGRACSCARARARRRRM